MVKKKDIQYIIEKTLYSIKCHTTIAEMHSQLDNMSQDEKNEKLSSILYEGQLRHYNILVNHLQVAKEELEEIEEDYDDGDGWMTGIEYDDRKLDVDLLIDELTDKIFRFERKIFDGNNEKLDGLTHINVSNYHADKQNNFLLGDKDTINELEQELIDKQSKYTSTLSGNLIDSANYWFSNGGRYNHEAYKSHDWKKMGVVSETVQKEIHNNNLRCRKGLDEIFDGLEPLGKDIIAYRSGVFDPTLVVGDHIKLKGYTSLTFQKQSAKTYQNVKNQSSGFYDTGTQWSYTVYVSGKNKGLCGNDSSFINDVSEHELVLPRNIDATIWDIDYENNTVVIVV